MLEQSQKKRVKMSQISEALKYQREIAGLSQTELAKKTKLSQQAISLWEHDERAPNINACIVLADFYGITLDELVIDEFGNETGEKKLGFTTSYATAGADYNFDNKSSYLSRTVIKSGL